MKRSWLILVGGLVLAAVGYACIYLHGTTEGRSVEHSSRPELAWLQKEYHLSNAQYARVMELHNAYASKCEEMCRLIDARNAQLQKLLTATNVVTPEIKQALIQAAEIRAECESSMLDHFYKVAQTMSPEQGRRYLDWAQQQILKPRQMMPGGTATHASPAMP